MASKLILNQSLPNIAVDPTSYQVLSATGQPTQTYTLTPNYPIGIIAFKVPQGAAYIVHANPWIRMKLYTSSSGTTEIAGGDTVSFWSKAPSDPKVSMGELVAQAQYRPWANLEYNQQKIGQYSASLLFPIDADFTLPENYLLIVSVATLLSGETVNWSASLIEIPVEQETNY